MKFRFYSILPSFFAVLFSISRFVNLPKHEHEQKKQKKMFFSLLFFNGAEISRNIRCVIV